jgi:UPF0716 family protein affecting phage T7 exclusion
MRILLFAAGVSLIVPGWITDLTGMTIVLGLLYIRAPDQLKRFTIGLFKRRAPDAVAGS